MAKLPDTEQPKLAMLELSGPQRDLHAALHRKCPRLAGWYLSAIQVLSDPNNPDRLAHAGHSLREVMEKFPECAGQSVVEVAGNAANILGEIKRDLDALSKKSPEGSDKELKDALVGIRKRVDEFYASGNQRVAQAQETFRGLVPGARMMPPVHEREILKVWKELRKYFNNVAHHNIDEVKEEDFRAKLLGFEVLAGAQLAPVPTDDMALLDELIKKAELGVTTVEVARKAVTVARKSPASLRYFYSQLRSPDWIEPLCALGVFSAPIEPIREERSINFPDWPETTYLARMAAISPSQVYEVIIRIPDTENFTIHQDFLSAAMAMPAELAGAIAKREAKWINQQEHLYTLYPEKVGDLISSLANAGQTEPALHLSRALLRVVPNPRGVVADHPFSVEPRAKFDHWHYEQVLKKTIPDLQAAAPYQCLDLTCDLLSAAVAIHCAMPDGEAKEDYSLIWRPLVAQEQFRDFKEILVSGVRDVAISISGMSHEAHEHVVAELTRREWRIFRRFFGAKQEQSAPAWQE